MLDCRAVREPPLPRPLDWVRPAKSDIAAFQSASVSLHKLCRARCGVFVSVVYRIAYAELLHGQNQRLG